MLGRRAGAARSVLQTLRRRATTDLKGRQFFESKPLGFEELTQLARHRGFVSPSSEVYGGIKGQYDYGPVGALLKRNIASAWWRRFIQERADTVGVDTAIIQHPTSTFTRLASPLTAPSRHSPSLLLSPSAPLQPGRPPATWPTSRTRRYHAKSATRNTASTRSSKTRA
jgi:hypothetical protein